MNKTTVRKAQFICFLVAHIPLAAVVVFAFSTDFSGQTDVLVVTFLATLATAILLWNYVGRAMARAPGLKTA